MLRDDPGGTGLGFRFDDVRGICLGLGPSQVRVIVLGGRNLYRQPLLVLRKVYSSVLAAFRQRIKHAVSGDNRYNRSLTTSSCLAF